MEKLQNSKFESFKKSEITELNQIKGGSKSYNRVDTCDGCEMVEVDHSFLGIKWTTYERNCDC
jgi:hypothetical protein